MVRDIVDARLVKIASRPIPSIGRGAEEHHAENERRMRGDDL